MTLIDRRKLLVEIGAVMCAPAIVRASSLMPVKSFNLGWTEFEYHLDAAGYERAGIRTAQTMANLWGLPVGIVRTGNASISWS